MRVSVQVEKAARVCAVCCASVRVSDQDSLGESETVCASEVIESGESASVNARVSASVSASDQSARTLRVRVNARNAMRNENASVDRAWPPSHHTSNAAHRSDVSSTCKTNGRGLQADVKLAHSWDHVEDTQARRQSEGGPRQHRLLLVRANVRAQRNRSQRAAVHVNPNVSETQEKNRAMTGCRCRVRRLPMTCLPVRALPVFAISSPVCRQGSAWPRSICVCSPHDRTAPCERTTADAKCFPARFVSKTMDKRTKRRTLRCFSKRAASRAKFACSPLIFLTLRFIPSSKAHNSTQKSACDEIGKSRMASLRIATTTSFVWFVIATPM